jgi:hypothetical protein
MRLPQHTLQYFSVRTVHFLTIGVAFALLCGVPVSAGAATQQLTCAPASLRFGSVVVGQTEALLVTVTNNGETSVTVSSVTASPEFTPSNLGLPLVLPPGQSFEVSVMFTPTATGWKGGSVVFASTASNPILDLGVGGMGENSEGLTASPASVSFGQVTIGAKSTLPVVLTNDRSWKVTLTALQTTGSGFSVSGPKVPLTLDVGQSTTVDVTFAPQVAGTDGGSLSISGPIAAAIPLTGTGSATQYSVSLFWNSTPGATGYNVYRGTSENGRYSKINSTLDANTAYTDSTVVSGQTYYYAATSVNSGGQESALSTPVVEAIVP